MTKSKTSRLSSIAGTTRWTLALAIGAGFVFFAPALQAHPCENHNNPNHKHCDNGGPDPTDRIAGTVTFAAGHPVGDASSSYHDGDATMNYLGENDSMQVAMNCQFNQFNLYPGGGDDRVRMDLAVTTVGPGDIETAISKCEGVDPVVFVNTDMTDDCTNNAGQDWGFNQLMRTSGSSVNVCDIKEAHTDVDANMRLQNNLHRLTTCKGGVNKCGIKREGIDVFYGDDPVCSAPVKIRCEQEDADGQCVIWEVEAVGNGCLSWESGGPAVASDMTFKATFTADP